MKVGLFIKIMIDTRAPKMGALKFYNFAVAVL